MRQCEGGAEEACPSYTLADACAYCEAGEAVDEEEEEVVVVEEEEEVVEPEEPELTEEEEADLAIVEEELAALGITSEYRATLAWESTADLDIYVKDVATGEVIYFSNMNGSNAKLDVDNTGGEYPAEGEKHVENISFNGDGGSFEVYVTNYDTNDDEDEIPFTVVTKNGQETNVYEDSWDINEMGTETNNKLDKMMRIATITKE